MKWTKENIWKKLHPIRTFQILFFWFFFLLFSFQHCPIKSMVCNFYFSPLKRNYFRSKKKIFFKYLPFVSCCCFFCYYRFCFFSLHSAIIEALTFLCLTWAKKKYIEFNLFAIRREKPNIVVDFLHLSHQWMAWHVWVTENLLFAL